MTVEASIQNIDGFAKARRRSSGHATDDEFIADYVHRFRTTSNVFHLENTMLADVLRAADHLPARVAFFVDDGVARAYGGLVESIESYARAHDDLFELTGPVVTVPGGEQCKNHRQEIDAILGAIDAAGLCRKSFVVAVAGGAVLDAVGFAASVAHRGVHLVRVPTTTLSQCDSGVGVKNGINAFGKKNWIGNFAVPWAVINDEGFLTTLSDRDWRCGFAEVVKVGLVKEAELFEQIAGRCPAIVRRDLAASVPLLNRSARVHMQHITDGGDPFERTRARPLDFGHWSAHKLEQMTDFRLRHGEAVAIGVALDVVYSAMTGMLDWAEMERVLECLRELGFALHDPALREAETLLLGLEEFRQHLGGQLTLTLIEGIGRQVDVHDMSEATVLDAVDFLAEAAERRATG